MDVPIFRDMVLILKIRCVAFDTHQERGSGFGVSTF